MKQTIAAGTSGFSYDAWKGCFYPEGLSAKKRLAYYAEQLPAVEINNTFYRMPKKTVLEAWASQVPESFRFAIKASRRITHFKRLKETEDETGYLLDVVSVLGPRLGALLFQLPPKLALDVDRLEAFLALLPAGTPAVFEFRHASWSDEAVDALLGAHACGRVLADTDEAPLDVAGIAGPRAYLRLRRSGYEDGALARVATQLVASGAEDGLVFFKHEEAGAGPRMARQFLGLVDQARASAAPRKASRPAAAAAAGGDAG